MPPPPAPLFVMDDHGLVLHWSADARRVFGYTAAQAVGMPALEVLAGTPAPGNWHVRSVPGAPGAREWGVWDAGDSGPAPRDATGRAAQVDGLDEAVLDAVFTQSAIGLHVLDPELRLLRLNAVAVGMRGVPEDQILGRPISEAYGPYAPDIPEDILRDVLATGRARREVLVRGRPPVDPHRRHVFSTSAYRIQDRSGRPLGVVATAVDVTARERAQGRLSLLHAAHERIGRSLDVLRTAEELVDVTVPAFADSAIVALTDSVLRGQEPELLPREGVPLLRCAATAGDCAAGRTPTVGAVLLPGLFGDPLPREPVLLLDGHPDVDGHSDGGSGSPEPEAGGKGAGGTGNGPGETVPGETGPVESGRPGSGDPASPALGPQASPGPQPSPADHPDHRTLVAPLIVRGQLFGVAAFHRPAASEAFDRGDLALAEQVAAHTATCLDNALRFTREHIVMTALQGWPLRQETATERAFEVAQRHRPGGTGAGSWFDVIPLPGARAALVVGKVEQPGISAVATMSQLRTAVHTLSTLDLDPHELLARLHATTLRLAREQVKVPGVEEPTASCTFVVHDPVSGRLDVARAGSSLFAVVRPDGSIDAAPLPSGPLLGGDGPPFASAEFSLPEGSTLCLASEDAAPEAGRPAELLVQALRHPDRSPERMADDVERLIAADAVLLVARTRHLPESELARWDVPADASAIGHTRRDVRRRLREWGTRVDPFAVELVVSELLTNAFRYGSEPITLRLIKGEHTLTCEVTDGALTAPHLRHAKANDEGGRGLHISASLTQCWGVRFSARDKTVWAEIAEDTTL
ncbi:SpoIIE family protein phosphatase [Streptomyces sp. NPDC053755]|uniref:SpoIIE family protein phosphatase n=1 Tax=Streptomyces sp. NPDC053755 TaxID=3155815 RepID=UPI003412750B